MTVNSHGVLDLVSVFAGWPITMTAGGPKAGKVAWKLIGNRRGLTYRPSLVFVNPSGITGKRARNSASVVTRSRDAGVWLQVGQM